MNFPNKLWDISKDAKDRYYSSFDQIKGYTSLGESHENIKNRIDQSSRLVTELKKQLTSNNLRSHNYIK